MLNTLVGMLYTLQRRRRAMPTRYPRSTGWPRRTTKGNKVPTLVSKLGDTTHTSDHGVLLVLPHTLLNWLQ